VPFVFSQRLHRQAEKLAGQRGPALVLVYRIHEALPQEFPGLEVKSAIDQTMRFQWVRKVTSRPSTYSCSTFFVQD
jgi:hypothetical protein